MASLWLCGSVGTPTPTPPSPSQVVIASHHPSFQFLKHGPKVSPFLFTLRVRNAVRLQIRRKSFSPFASNSNPSGGDSLHENNETTTSDAGQDPPFLTILAGLLVFFLVSWILGSIVMWLLGLIIKLPSK